MPVVDHPVHPDTVGGDRYADCQSKVRRDGYWAPDMSTRTQPPMPRWVWVTDSSTTACRYNRSLSDTKCTGCPQLGLGDEHYAP